MSETDVNSVTLGPIELYLGYALPFTLIWAILGGLGNRKMAKNIKLPWLSPPPWVFSVVWPLLYLAMSIAFWIVRMQFGSDDDDAKLSYILYWVLCGTLAVWSWLYFRLGFYRFSVLWILGCLGVSIATCYEFFQHDDVAGGLLVPLCAWLGYASMLNFFSVLNIFKSSDSILKVHHQHQHQNQHQHQHQPIQQSHQKPSKHHSFPSQSNLGFVNNSNSVVFKSNEMAFLSSAGV